MSSGVAFRPAPQSGGLGFLFFFSEDRVICVFVSAGYQPRWLGKDHVLHSRFALILGLDLLRRLNCSKCSLITASRTNLKYLVGEVYGKKD